MKYLYIVWQLPIQLESCCCNNFIIFFPCTSKARRERNPVQRTEHLWIQFCQLPVRTRDLCMEITPIPAPSQGTLHAQSSTTFRNEFPGASHRETLSCPWAIIVSNYEFSDHSEQIRPGRKLYPWCSRIPFISTMTKNVPRDRCHAEAPRTRRVAASAHGLLCMQILQLHTIFVLESIKLTQN